MTEIELAQQHVELLPAREALALLNINAIIAANTSAAVNALTVNSTAYSEAVQLIYVDQD